MQLFSHMRNLLSFGVVAALFAAVTLEAHASARAELFSGDSGVWISDEGEPPAQTETPARPAPGRGSPPPEARRGQQRAEEVRPFTEEELQRAEEWRERRAAVRTGRIGRPVDGKPFSDADRARIASIPVDQYPPGIQRRLAEGRDLPPGIERRLDRDRGLPEGWQQRLEPGEVLDTELERGVTEIPRGLRRRLPAVPADHEDLLVGDQLVRVMRHSREIVDSVPVGPGRAAQVPAPAETTPPSERPRGPARR